MKKKCLMVSVAFLAILIMANFTFAQIKTGTIRGVVKDETGAVLPGATVELRGEALMGIRTETSSERGIFRFPALPVGIYEVTVSLEGFQTVNRKDLKVGIGGTVFLDIALKLAAVEETITVTGESPIVDIAKTSFSSTFDSKALENLPTRRYTFFDMLQASPGITPPSIESSRVSAFGSEVKSNAYYLNGIDISAPSTGAAWPWPMPDMIQELEITGVGAPAEYGNFQGAIINVVSKSGSNSFHGAAKYFFQHDKLTGNNTPEEKWPYHIDHWHQAVFNVGGPIVKDKLWFWAGLMHDVNRITGVGADPQYAPEYRLPNVVTKIDAQISDKNKIGFFLHHEWYKNPAMPTEFAPIETVSEEIAPALSLTAEWMSILSNKTYIELKYAGFYTNLKWDPVANDLTTPGHYDWGTGYASVNATGFYHWPTNRSQVNGSVSHFAEDFLSGDHDFKFGVQFSRGYSDFVWGYPGGVTYYDWMNEPYVAYFRNPSHYGGLNRQVGLFLDDSWTVSNRLTINLGVRFDYNHGEIPDFNELDRFEQPTGVKIPGIPNVANWKLVSPRIGMNYQLTADKKTILRASYGRYYDSLIIGDFDDATPAMGTLYVYEYDSATRAYDIPWYSWSPISDLGLDPDLKAPYTDQFSLAVEREVAPNFSLSATFIYKKSLNSISRLNTAAQYTEIPFYDEYSGNTISVYNQVMPLENFYLVTNPGDKVTYKGLMLVANKRLSDNWQLYSSLTLSRAWMVPKGYRDKNELINSEGPMRIERARDRTWMFKIGGAYLAPYDILIGTNIIYQQGASWERTVRVSGLNQGGRAIMAEPRGSRRMPNEIYFDLKVEKDFTFAEKYNAKISFDVFNLLNRDTNLSWASTQAESPSWLVPSDFIAPRRAMIGLQFVF
jgi:outer membrane receptor protein involved in Fe transport